MSGLGLVGPALLSSALLWWIWQLLPGKVIHSAHLSIHTHNDPVAPRLSSQPALMLCTQQTRWRKRADNVTRPPLAFHARYAPEDGSFSPQNNWADWNTVTPFVSFFFFFFFFTSTRSLKIGQTPRRCGSTENGCCGGRVHWNRGAAIAPSGEGWRSYYTYNTAPSSHNNVELPSGL